MELKRRVEHGKLAIIRHGAATVSVERPVNIPTTLQLGRPMKLDEGRVRRPVTHKRWL
jgi:hypothetical protein